MCLDDDNRRQPSISGCGLADLECTDDLGINYYAVIPAANEDFSIPAVRF